MSRRNYKQAKTAADQLPPHSVENEAAVIGSMLLDPVQACSECGEWGVSWRWFYDLRHQVLFDVLWRMYQAGKAIDTLTVYEEVRRGADVPEENQGDEAGREVGLEQLGGLEYLSQLPEQVPSVANLPTYLEQLQDAYLRRSLLRMCTQTAGHVFEKTATQELLARVEKGVALLAEQREATGEQRIKPLMLEVVKRLEDYHRGHAQIRGLTTGLEYVDKLLCGIGGDSGNYVVLSGRPNAGKTAFAVQLVAHAALDYEWFEPGTAPEDPVIRHVGIPVGVFSLEMTARALVQRMLFQRAQADMQRWRNGFATNADMAPLTVAAANLTKPDNIFIDDTARCTIDVLKAKARRWKREHGVKLVVIDYIQLLRASSRRFREDRVQELAEISGEIQALGKELNIPIVVLAQMNRDSEKDPNRPPRLSDLKDCGAIEQDADLVGFLWKPKLKDKEQEVFEQAVGHVYGDDWSKSPDRVDLLWAKNRFGPTGPCKLLFQRSCTLFMDYVVWLKEHGQKTPALGESQYDRGEQDRTLPTNEEMGL